MLGPYFAQCPRLIAKNLAVFAIAAGLLLTRTGQARAGAVLDFEDQNVAPTTGRSTAQGVGIITAGFRYSPGPNNSSGLNEIRVSNAEQSFSYNGTTVCFSHDDGVLTTVGGAPFSLQQFDFAGFPLNRERPFFVDGVRADGTTISQFFIPDGFVDGKGGRVDFQTGFMLGDWTNLISVTWTHTGPGTDEGVFALDNIYVDAVPEPASIVLAATAAAALFTVAVRQHRRGSVRRQRSVSGVASRPREHEQLVANGGARPGRQSPAHSEMPHGHDS